MDFWIAAVSFLFSFGKGDCLGKLAFFKSKYDMRYLKLMTEKYLYINYGIKDELSLIQDEYGYKIPCDEFDVKKLTEAFADSLIRRYVCFNVFEYFNEQSENLILTEITYDEICFRLDCDDICKLRTIFAKKMLDLTDKTYSLNIDGFQTFNFCDENMILKEAIEDIVLSVEAIEEYQNIIYTLNDFVFRSIPKCDTISIIPEVNGDFAIYFDDSRKRMYTNDNDEIIDLLLRELPKKVVIYNTKNISNQNLTSTLLQIFGKRLCVLNPDL